MALPFGEERLRKVGAHAALRLDALPRLRLAGLALLDEIDVGPDGRGGEDEEKEGEGGGPHGAGRGERDGTSPDIARQAWLFK